MSKTFCLKVWGEYACFTRPEMKAERVSYEVITPSSARAIFEAILWKPEIQWQITQIDLLKPIQWISIRRNELGSTISVSKIKTAMKKGKGNLCTYIEEDRQQRAGLLLKEPAYLIYGVISVKEPYHQTNSLTKYEEMFSRRAKKGQCILQPYLGCREFSANVELIENIIDAPQPFPIDKDFGWMLYDMNYADAFRPMFYQAKMSNGSIIVPSAASGEVKQ